MIEPLARLQAEQHKWRESERRGHDVGEVALKEWCRRNWRSFCRWRFYEHLTAMSFYPEFGTRNHGCLIDPRLKEDPVVKFVVERLRDFLWENLDFCGKRPIPPEIDRTHLRVTGHD